MAEFRMICNQAADFGPDRGELFRVTADRIGKPVLAPEWIKKTIMWGFLVSEGAIQILKDDESQKTPEKAAVNRSDPKTSKELSEVLGALMTPVEVKTEVSTEGKRPYTRRKKG